MYYNPREVPIPNKIDHMVLFNIISSFVMSMLPRVDIHENVDLQLYPNILKESINKIVIGDLHANPMLLVYSLIKYNIIVLDPDLYDILYDLLSIDQSVLPFNFEQMSVVKDIINNSMIVSNQNVKKVLLLGDILADRGSNDYFILLLLEKMHGSIDYSITLSNHDLEFISQAEYKFTRNGYYDNTNLFLMPTKNTISPKFGSFMHSYETFKTMINQPELWCADVKRHSLQIYHNIYKQHLLLVDYYSDNDSITLFQHAATGIKTIKDIVYKLNGLTWIGPTQFNSDTIKDLTTSIDDMNEHFVKLIKDRNWFVKFFPKSDTNPIKNNPIIKIIWNRVSNDDTVFYDGMYDKYMNYNVYIVHGHDPTVPVQFKEVVYSLDHRLGCYMKTIYSLADKGTLTVMLF